MNPKRPGRLIDSKPRAQRYEERGNGRALVSAGSPEPERPSIVPARPAGKKQAASGGRRRLLVVACFVAAAAMPIALVAVGLIGPDFLFVVLAAIALAVMALGGLADADAKDTPVDGPERKRRPRSSPNLHNGGTSASPRAPTLDLDHDKKRTSQ